MYGNVNMCIGMCTCVWECVYISYKCKRMCTKSSVEYTSDTDFVAKNSFMYRYIVFTIKSIPGPVIHLRIMSLVLRQSIN